MVRQLIRRSDKQDDGPEPNPPYYLAPTFWTPGTSTSTSASDSASASACARAGAGANGNASASASANASASTSTSTSTSTKGNVEWLAPKIIGSVPHIENCIWPWEERQCIVQGRGGTILKEIEFCIKLAAPPYDTIRQLKTTEKDLCESR
jgi:hypothetical protein